MRSNFIRFNIPLNCLMINWLYLQTMSKKNISDARRRANCANNHDNPPIDHLEKERPCVSARVTISSNARTKSYFYNINIKFCLRKSLRDSLVMWIFCGIIDYRLERSI